MIYGYKSYYSVLHFKPSRLSSKSTFMTDLPRCNGLTVRDDFLPSRTLSQGVCDEVYNRHRHNQVPSWGRPSDIQHYSPKSNYRHVRVTGTHQLGWHNVYDNHRVCGLGGIGTEVALICNLGHEK